MDYRIGVTIDINYVDKHTGKAMNRIFPKWFMDEGIDEIKRLICHGQEFTVTSTVEDITPIMVTGFHKPRTVSATE